MNRTLSSPPVMGADNVPLLWADYNVRVLPVVHTCQCGRPDSEHSFAEMLIHATQPSIEERTHLAAAS